MLLSKAHLSTLLITCLVASSTAQTGWKYDAASRTATVTTADGQLELHLDLSKGCAIDKLSVGKTQVESLARPICTGFEIGDTWYKSDSLRAPVRVLPQGKSLLISDIYLEGGGMKVEEQWTFKVANGKVEWKIDRIYLTGGTLDDSAMPMFSFAKLDTWTAAQLGTGGVAWPKLFDQTNSTYGVHMNSATFWNSNLPECLSISASGNDRLQTQAKPRQAPQALTFSRQENGVFSMSSIATRGPLLQKLNLARFRKGRQDVWLPFPVERNEIVSSTIEITAKNYQQTFGRGDFKSLDTNAITNLENTIGRIGVIDDKLIGSNGWYSGYICLHEPWIGLIGLGLDDPNYIRNYARALDKSRDQAMSSNGMVLSRWDYDNGDAKPGTYNQYGYYEAQWGRLEDTQSSYVADVADEFNLNGSIPWVKGQKLACEKALGYLLRRDTNGNHLVEMETDSHLQKRSSDWIDIVWASYENAFVNAQLYHSLLAWANVEHILHDETKAAYYRDYAAKLKISFNKPIDQGGFWDSKNKWYVYWRDKDGSIHGDNLVIHVNFTALAEGLCEGPRRKVLLDNIENRMKQEHLFAWPACMYGYEPGEGANDVFPTYENGDIFIGWEENGIRAYAPDQPAVALKYLRNIVNQYKKDGLAFQRYLRKTQKGAGDDILAGNCNAVVGLYRDIYGIQPQYNRLYLDPHLSPELNGTKVDYALRGQDLKLGLSLGDYRVSLGHRIVSSPSAFGVNFSSGRSSFYPGSSEKPELTTSASQMNILSWGRTKKWTVKDRFGRVVLLDFPNLPQGRTYVLILDGKPFTTLTSSSHEIWIQAQTKAKVVLELKQTR